MKGIVCLRTLCGLRDTGIRRHEESTTGGKPEIFVFGPIQISVVVGSYVPLENKYSLYVLYYGIKVLKTSTVEENLLLWNMSNTKYCNNPAESNTWLVQQQQQHRKLNTR